MTTIINVHILLGLVYNNFLYCSLLFPLQSSAFYTFISFLIMNNYNPIHFFVKGISYEESRKTIYYSHLAFDRCEFYKKDSTI